MPDLRFSDFKKLDGVRFERCEDLLEINPVLGPINTDSRTIREGEIFWVLKGERFDAHDFVPMAAEKGAAFAVVEHTVQAPAEFPMVVVPDSLKALQQLAAIKRQRFKHPVIALTGSNGKTTTKEMIAHVLSAKWKVHKTEGNLNNHIGCPLTLLRLKPWHQVAVIEMGSNHPGEIAALAQIVQPDWALVTNIGPAHLEHFGSLENVAREKLSLFENMRPETMIFVNADDPLIRPYARKDVRRVTYGFENPADIRGEILRVERDGTCVFRLNRQVEIHLAVPGVHNAYNALAAAAVALFSGMSETEIKEALESYHSFDKRMQQTEINGVRVINDTYNANPRSMEAAFETLSRMERGAGLFLALGDMLELGRESDRLHGWVLEKALQLAPDGIFVIGEAFARAAEVLNRPEIEVFDAHQALAEALKKRLKPGALLFLKGSRSMQMEKILEFLK
jgi:UDP-N-acetylmuramoyl-tripeptide--D-alanyl-D-alanine ligase